MTLNVTQLAGFGAGTSGGTTFADILSDLGLATPWIIWDAGDRVSFPASDSQTLYDVQENVDLYLGVDGSVAADDPQFTGNVGGGSSNEIFTLASGDFFSPTAAVTTEEDNLHQSGAVFSMINIFYLAGAASSYSPAFWNSNGGNASNGTGALWSYNSGGSRSHQLFVTNEPSTTVLSKTSDADNLKGTAWNMMGVTCREGVSNESFFTTYNADFTGYDPVSTDKWTANYSSPDTGSVTGSRVMFSRTGECVQRAGAVWEGGYITEANMAAIWAEVQTAWGIS